MTGHALVALSAHAVPLRPVAGCLLLVPFSASRPLSVTFLIRRASSLRAIATLFLPLFPDPGPLLLEVLCAGSSAPRRGRCGMAVIILRAAAIRRPATLLLRVPFSAP